MRKFAIGFFLFIVAIICYTGFSKNPTRPNETLLKYMVPKVSDKDTVWTWKGRILAATGNDFSIDADNDCLADFTALSFYGKNLKLGDVVTGKVELDRWNQNYQKQMIDNGK